jgi:hypothetical protein
MIVVASGKEEQRDRYRSIGSEVEGVDYGPLTS